MRLGKDLKYFLLLKLLVPLGYGFLCLYAKTLRLKTEGAAELISHLKSGRRVVMATWHQRFYGGFFVPKALGRKTCIMISRSRDGDYIADVVSRIGWVPVRGSSSRGGREALRVMESALVSDKICAHIVDGPTGPPRVIKPGLISLAQKAQAAICPVFISYKNAWSFSSWDKFMVPKPFSEVLLRFAGLISVPAELCSESFEEFRQKVGHVFIEGYRDADGYWNK